MFSLEWRDLRRFSGALLFCVKRHRDKETQHRSEFDRLDPVRRWGDFKSGRVLGTRCFSSHFSCCSCASRKRLMWRLLLKSLQSGLKREIDSKSSCVTNLPRDVLCWNFSPISVIGAASTVCYHILPKNVKYSHQKRSSNRKKGIRDAYSLLSLSNWSSLLAFLEVVSCRSKCDLRILIFLEKWK